MVSQSIAIKMPISQRPIFCTIYNIMSTNRYDAVHFGAISEDGRLFLWGRNNHGELGDGSRLGNRIPKLVKGELTNLKVVQVALGMHYTMALTDKGQLFCCGYIGVRFLFRSDLDIGNKWPQRVEVGIGNCKAVAVACTDNTPYVLLKDGQLFSWGNEVTTKFYEKNDYYVGRKFQHDPVRVDDVIGNKILQIVCGLEHCLALTESGQLFTWKNNASYCCTLPVQVASQFGKAVKIAAFDCISEAEFADGTVRAWKMT